MEYIVRLEFPEAADVTTGDFHVAYSHYLRYKCSDAASSLILAEPLQPAQLMNAAR